MPYVQIRVSVPLTQEKIEQLASAAMNAIDLIPGKSAPVTMAEVVPDCALYFGATDGGPCAMVAVAANNEPDPEALKAYSRSLCGAISDITGIETRRIYVKHHGYPVWHSGRMFAE